jgi:hypothetical protein
MPIALEYEPSVPVSKLLRDHHRGYSSGDEE